MLKSNKKASSEKKRITKSQVLFPAVRYGIIFALDILLSTTRWFDLYLQNDFTPAGQTDEKEKGREIKKTETSEE